MGIAVDESKRGTFVAINVVPLIDVLLVLLVIFMIIQHPQMGLKADIPQQADSPFLTPPPEVIVVQVLADGSLKVNQQPVTWEALYEELEQVFRTRADHTAFIRGDAIVEFQAVATVIDIMHTAGITTVGLMTPELEKSR
jgi:biopolymer transport protein TolR